MVLQYVTVLQSNPLVAVLQQKISNAGQAKIWGLEPEGDWAATSIQAHHIDRVLRPIGASFARWLASFETMKRIQSSSD